MSKKLICKKCGSELQFSEGSGVYFCPECSRKKIMSEDNESMDFNEDECADESSYVTCHQCGRKYDPLDSDAEKPKRFCCVACECGY